MAKPTMLYASPFPPKKSGISDYSVVLVKALSEFYDITLYSDNYIIEEDSLKAFPVVRHGYDEIDFDSQHCSSSPSLRQASSVSRESSVS